MLVQNLRSSSGEIQNWTLYSKGKEEEADTPDGWVVGLMSREIVYGACHSCLKMSRSPHLPSRILKPMIDRAQSCILWSQQPYSSLYVVSLRQLQLWEQWAEHTFYAQGRGWRVLDCLRSAHGPVGGHSLSMTSSDRHQLSCSFFHL